MADEVKLANVVRFERQGPKWAARIGPREMGLEATGRTILHAMTYLMVRCEALGWPFDDSWRDNLE